MRREQGWLRIWFRYWPKSDVHRLGHRKCGRVRTLWHTGWLQLSNARNSECEIVTVVRMDFDCEIAELDISEKEHFVARAGQIIVDLCGQLQVISRHRLQHRTIVECQTTFFGRSRILSLINQNSLSILIRQPAGCRDGALVDFPTNALLHQPTKPKLLMRRPSFLSAIELWTSIGFNSDTVMN